MSSRSVPPKTVPAKTPLSPPTINRHQIAVLLTENAAISASWTYHRQYGSFRGTKVEMSALPSYGKESESSQAIGYQFQQESLVLSFGNKKAPKHRRAPGPDKFRRLEILQIIREMTKEAKPTTSFADHTFFTLTIPERNT